MDDESQGELFGFGAYGAYRYNDPETSKKAALSVDANRLEAIFVEALSKCPDRMATSEEIAGRTGIRLNSISPRTAPLARKGKIVDSGIRRNGRIVWKLKEE